MQNLDVISVNLWQIIVSLCNLVIIFLILKKLLFKPVKKILAKRQQELSEQYNAADKAEHEAMNAKQQWENRIKNADSEADNIIKIATEKANSRSEKILSDAKADAEGIVSRAKTEAELERKKNEAGMKDEIIGVSEALTEKLLQRELNDSDHRNFINEFLDRLGDENE